jgi:catechol 2,3-dioxygenase-like lactoylglutathione lyase family enzyme
LGSSATSAITKVDTIGIPSRNTERSRAFYVETLGLRPDERSWNEFWIGDTCFAIWEPERAGMEFHALKNGLALLRVDDVARAREELGAKGVEFFGETLDTGVCHMAFFRDPDGNELALHKRYAPFPDGSTP